MRAPCSMGHCEEVSWGQQLLFAVYAGESKGGRRRLSAAVSVCLSAWPCPPAAPCCLPHLQPCRAAVTSAEQGQDALPQPWEQVGMLGDPLWLWMWFSHHLLLPRRFPFPVEITAFHSLIYCISQWVILGGSRGGTTKLHERPFCINVLSPFHCSVFYLGLHYECLSVKASGHCEPLKVLYIVVTV